MRRGFGIAAGTEPALVEQVARLAEASGYASVWTNDTPSSDGLEVAAAIARVTTNIRIGIGVVPIDVRPVEAIADRVRQTQMPTARFVLGIGAGLHSSPQRAVRSAVAELRRLLPAGTKIGVAAMGPKMCALAGEVADLVLLNWMNADRIGWARQIAERSGRSPEIACYVRGALGAGALDRISEEANRYAFLPHYRRHFEAMSSGTDPIGVAIDGHPGPTCSSPTITCSTRPSCVLSPGPAPQKRSWRYSGLQPPNPYSTPASVTSHFIKSS